MAVVYAVQGDSEDECARELARICEVFGARPVGRIMQLTGRSRWMARAEPAPEPE